MVPSPDGKKKKKNNNNKLKMCRVRFGNIYIYSWIALKLN